MPATRGIRVVLADDDPTYLDALASTLEADGRFEVIGLAGNGAEAFQLGCWQEPDVLVMDAEMPGLGGLDAARLLRQSRPDSRVVLVTSADVVAHCSAPGVDAFVTKSSLDEIPDLVADLVGRLHESRTPPGACTSKCISQRLRHEKLERAACFSGRACGRSSGVFARWSPRERISVPRHRDDRVSSMLQRPRMRPLIRGLRALKSARADCSACAT